MFYNKTCRLGGTKTTLKWVKKMIEIKIYIPTQNNEKKTFSQPHHRVFEMLAVEIFGGITRQNGDQILFQGIWLDSETDTLYNDDNIVYMIAINSIMDAINLQTLVEFAKEHYQQKTIYLSYLGIA